MQLKRILVVDDHDPDLRYADIILKSAVVAEQIVLLHTGGQALQYMKGADAAQVSLILLDINMPEMSGFEFLQAYQPLVDQSLASALVVMLTSSSAEADRLAAADFSCVKGYVVKPLTRLAALQLPQIGAAGGSDQGLD